MQASATPQNVMKMAEMASRTAQLWLEFAEDEASHPERAQPAPDPYNQAFYSFTRKDPDNEVGPALSAAHWPLSAVPCQSDQCMWDAKCTSATLACDCTSERYLGVQKVATLIGQESLETLLQLATRDPGMLCK